MKNDRVNIKLWISSVDKFWIGAVPHKNLQQKIKYVLVSNHETSRPMKFTTNASSRSNRQKKSILLEIFISKHHYIITNMVFKNNEKIFNSHTIYKLYYKLNRNKSQLDVRRPGEGKKFVCVL